MESFVSYTVSGLMSLFAALIGVAYPLILQATQRIDDKYHSTTLTQYILNKTSFKLFRVLMAIAIPIAIIAPFALYFYSSNLIWCYGVLGIQAVVTCAQLLNLYYINHVIQDAIIPHKFLRMLIAENGERNIRIKEIFDFSRLHVLDAHPGLIMQAVDVVYKYIKSEAHTESDTCNEILNSIRKLLEESDPKRRTFYCESSDFWAVLLSPETKMGDEMRNYWIWRFLQASIKANNTDHIFRYWSWADQYAGYSTAQMEEADSHTEDKKNAFVHFNTMVCASLVYSGNWKALNDVLYYSHMYPPKYDLLPNTFTAIVDELRFIIASDFNWIVKFSMYGMKGGVTIEDEIKFQAIRYLALAYLRLQSVNDYNITYSEPLSLPYLGDNISECKSDLESAERLLWTVQKWQQQPETVKQCLISQYDYSERANELLKKYITALTDHIIELQKHPKVSQTKIERFVSELRETIEEDPLNIPAVATKPEGFELAYKKSRYEKVFQVVKTYLAEGVEWGYWLPEGMVRDINNDVRWAYYSQCFLLRGAVKSYSIGFHQLVKGIEQMGLDENYEVWVSDNLLERYQYIDKIDAEKMQSDGNNTWSINGCELHQFECRSSVAIVTKKGDMPVAYSKEFSLLNERGMTEVESQSHFYSNIENKEKNSLDEEHYGINLGRIVEFYAPKDYEFVLLNLAIPEAEPSDLNSIAPIVELLSPAKRKSNKWQRRKK